MWKKKQQKWEKKSKSLLFRIRKMFRTFMKMLDQFLGWAQNLHKFLLGPQVLAIPLIPEPPSAQPCEKAPYPGTAIQQTLSNCQPAGYNWCFHQSGERCDQGAWKAPSSFCSPCSRQQHVQSQKDRHCGIFSKPMYGSSRLACTSIPISAPSPQIKSNEKQEAEC